MRGLLVLVSIIGITFGANMHGLTLDQISDLIIANMDKNSDQVIGLNEMVEEFATHYDADGNACISEHEFVHQWNKDYHDDHQAATHLYQHLDIDRDGCLTQTDLAIHYGVMDHDDNNSVSYDEFRAYMHQVHPDRVGHGHGHK